MAEPVRNLSQVAAAPMDSPGQAQEQPPIPVWQRQPGESLLWYNRFKIYRGLGYKRSLVAALLQEQGKAKVLESPKANEKPGVTSARGSQKYGKSTAKVRQLAEVPKPAAPAPAQQVPGSWKQASIKYHWVERCAAYDEHRIDTMVESSIDDLLDGPATVFHRVMMLKSLLENMRLTLNANSSKMSFEQFCMWTQRMQSLMKQIADEMSIYDEAVTRVILRKQSEQMYHEYDKNKAAATAVMKQAETTITEGTSAERQKMLDEIDREMKRRGLR